MEIIKCYCKSLQSNTMMYNYSYRLIKCNKIFKNNIIKKSTTAYGIEVERQDILDGKLVNIERECVKVISPNESKVDKLLRILYGNTVSPIHTLSILGESIDNCACDFDRI